MSQQSEKVPCFQSNCEGGWIRGRRFANGQWYSTASPCPRCGGRGVLWVYPSAYSKKQVAEGGQK